MIDSAPIGVVDLGLCARANFGRANGVRIRYTQCTLAHIGSNLPRLVGKDKGTAFGSSSCTCTRHRSREYKVAGLQQ